MFYRDDEVYTPLERKLLWMLAIIITSALIWTTYIWWTYRVHSLHWEENFSHMTPTEFWDINKKPKSLT